MKKKKLIKQPGEAALPASFFGWPEETQKGGLKAEYEDTLFATGFVHRINIQIAEAGWADLLKNPVKKTRYNADITIDGETLKNVVLSTKGVSRLVFPALKPGNQRYSFKIKFGKNEKFQTCHGLDKLDLNCCFRDTTLMKDYFSYRLFRIAGVPAPLTGHAWVTVNGKDHGLYLMVEKPEESFLARNFGTGVLYKPCTGAMQMTLEEAKYLKEHGIPDGYISDESRGGDFVYTNDDPASYPDIFENRKTDGGQERRRGSDRVHQNAVAG